MKFARGKNMTIRASEVVPAGIIFEIADLEIERFTNLGYEILDENPEAPDSGNLIVPPEGSSLGKTLDNNGDNEGETGTESGNTDEINTLNSSEEAAAKMGTQAVKPATTVTAVKPKATAPK